MSKKKTQSASAFEMIKVRLRAERARLASSARSVCGRKLAACLSTRMFQCGRTNTVKEQLFLPVRDSQLLVAVVENIGEAPETLSQMAADKHPEVRTAVADNPACTGGHTDGSGPRS
jgi:hypothetical protein